MKSATLGQNTSVLEVTNISSNGLWLLLHDRELFLGYDQFPWFRNATVEQILEVELPTEEHLYWPKLDIDLTIESIEHPDRYPLIYKGNA